VPALGLNIAASEQGSRPKNAESYDLYLRAIAASHDPQPNSVAIAALERAVALDPGYAPAWAEISARYLLDSDYGTGGSVSFEKARAAADRAAAADPKLADAVDAISILRAESGDLNGAFDSARRQLNVRPDRSDTHFAMSYILRYAGLLDESAAECDKALQIDPANRSIRSCAYVFMGLGRYDRAEDFVRLDPDSSWGRSTRMHLLLDRGDTKGASEVLARLPKDTSTQFGLRAMILMRPRAEELDTLQKAEDKLLAGIQDPEVRTGVARDWSYAGRPQLALRYMREAVKQNYCNYQDMEAEPMLAEMRKLPEYPALRQDALACQQRFLAHRAEVTK